MKKIAFIMSLFMCVCSFAACSDADEDMSSVSKTTAASTTAASKATEEETEEDTTAEETTEEETTTVEAADASGENSFVRGISHGQVYTNDFAKIRLEVPSGWKYSTDKELMASVNIALEDYGNDDKKLMEDLLKQTTIYDANVTNPSTGDNIIILFENLKIQGVDPKKFTLDMYLARVTELLKATPNIKYSDPTAAEDITIGGQKFRKISVNAEYLGYKMVQSYYVRNVGDYMLGYIITCGDSGKKASDYEVFFKDYE